MFQDYLVPLKLMVSEVGKGKTKSVKEDFFALKDGMSQGLREEWSAEPEPFSISFPSPNCQFSFIEF